MTIVLGLVVLGTVGQLLDRVTGTSAAATARWMSAAWWRRSGTYPTVVERQYWSVVELERDRSAMAGMGYEVIDSAPVERMPQEAVLQGRMARHARRIPVASVTYRRRNASA